MTDEKNNAPARREMPLPGVAAICLYLFLIAGTVALGVAGGHYPKLFVLFTTLFLAAGGGLLASFRWAWALTMGAVFLLMAYNAWAFGVGHQFAAGAQGLLNLVFFLYLIRPEVRGRLR